ncbi:glycosyltransferase family 2 protein [Sphingomonas sp. C8-2]|jgi:glycosyltransferase involved in cell wall biosynthesis|nr:glycosyltransferase family 2 protein [Sphingomonas sp. C8-2]
MIDQALVSIIVPVYNVERYIHSCLNSIRKQTYSNLEIIVVEDCSTDLSAKELYLHLEDNRIRIIQHDRNRGLSAARNTGINAATGEYLLFVDSDDAVDVKLVEICLDCALKMKADLVSYDFHSFEDGDAVLKTEQDYKNFRKIDKSYFDMPYFAWLKFIKTSLLKKKEIRFPEGVFYEDWPFHWRLGFAAPRKAHIDHKLYRYRQHGESITSSTAEKLLDIFDVQNIVMDLPEVERVADNRLILANKIRDSHWNSLIRVDEDFLSRAVERARSVDQRMRDMGCIAEYSWRRFAMMVAIRLPNLWGVQALRFFATFVRKQTGKYR